MGAGGQYQVMGVTADLILPDIIPEVDNSAKYSGLQGTGSVSVGVDYTHVANTTTTNLYKSALKTIQKNKRQNDFGIQP